MLRTVVVVDVLGWVVVVNLISVSMNRESKIVCCMNIKFFRSNQIRNKLNLLKFHLLERLKKCAIQNVVNVKLTIKRF